jgi:hypothetical protein
MTAESKDRQALQALADMNWLEDDGGDTPGLSAAKEEARAALQSPDPCAALADALRALIYSCQCANQRVMYEATAALAAYEGSKS